VVVHESRSVVPEFGEKRLPHLVGRLGVGTELPADVLLDPFVDDPPQGHFRRVERIVESKMKSGRFGIRSLPSHGDRAHHQGGAPTLPNQRKSEPAASTFSSKPRMLPRDGEPAERFGQRPARDADPGSSHEKSPNRVRRVDPEELREKDAVPGGLEQPDGECPPGAMRRLEIPTVGGAFGPGAATGAGRSGAELPAPERVREEAAQLPFAISSRRRVGGPLRGRTARRRNRRDPSDRPSTG